MSNQYNPKETVQKGVTRGAMAMTPVMVASVIAWLLKIIWKIEIPAEIALTLVLLPGFIMSGVLHGIESWVRFKKKLKRITEE